MVFPLFFRLFFTVIHKADIEVYRVRDTVDLSGL